MMKFRNIIKNALINQPKTLFLVVIQYLSVNCTFSKAQNIKLAHNIEEYNNNNGKTIVTYSKTCSTTNLHLIWKAFLAISIILLSNVYITETYAGDEATAKETYTGEEAKVVEKTNTKGFLNTLKSIFYVDSKYEGDTSGYYNYNRPIASYNQCSLETLKKQYMENPDKNCWYCNIISTMTGAYLEAVANIMNIVETLALLILRYGFLIWLAYYILQQVSSLAPITPGKMLQEILMMGFKVLLATLAVHQGISLLTEFFLDPVMLFGIDYGQTMLNGVMEKEVLGGAS